MDSVDPAHVEAHEDREPEPDVRKRDEESGYNAARIYTPKLSSEIARYIDTRSALSSR